MRALLLHGYSRRNAGDGLLVDLSLDLISRAGIPANEVAVAALDPASFADLQSVIPLPVVGGRRARMIAVLGSPARARKLARAARSADLVVGVGGGYLRAGSAAESLKTLVAHVPQLYAATKAKRSIYLPQSIGPLRGPVGALIRRWLRKVDVVFVRDERSATEVEGAIRLPDLACLADQTTSIVRRAEPAGARRVVVLARPLPRPRHYGELLTRLADQLRRTVQVEFAVQSSVGLGNDDRAFVAALAGKQGLRPAADSIPGASAVVSVRLHGAIASLQQGVPAIHLSYERKGWGAYGDLGITEWVHSARDFDPDLVAGQVTELAHDAGRYWSSIDARSERLRLERSRLIDELAIGIERSERFTAPGGVSRGPAAD